MSEKEMCSSWTETGGKGLKKNFSFNNLGISFYEKLSALSVRKQPSPRILEL